MVKPLAPHRIDFKALAKPARETIALVAVLLIALKLNHSVEYHFPTAWMLSAIVLAFALTPVDFSVAEASQRRLLQWLGALTAFYAFLHYPLLAPLPTAAAYWWFALLLCMWGLSLACGVASLRFPSLALVPAAYLYWSKQVAGLVTGLPHLLTLDIAPLPEVTVCIVVGLAIARLHPMLRRSTNIGREAVVEFGAITLLFAIGIHLANYFYSAVAKLELQGPPLAWVRFNNPLYIYLAAVDDGHITFSNVPWLSRAIVYLLDKTHVLSNLAVLSAQALAIGAFFFPKRGLILLLIFYDVMHVVIAIAAGANFWPWIMLNLAIVAVVASPSFKRPAPLCGALGAVFVAISPQVANVARLGWFDSGANNSLLFEAEDRAGRRYFVPTNFFGFYSYPIAHGMYGIPEARGGFTTGTPNGGVTDYALARAGAACDVQRLVDPNLADAPAAALGRFVLDYHRMMIGLQHSGISVPYNLYPHHFYVRPSLGMSFAGLDKDDVVAYIYRRESVCLSVRDGLPFRTLVSTGEMRFDVTHN